MTNSFAEFQNAKMFMVIGSNMTEAHPVASTFLKNAVMNGAKLILVDPRRQPLADFADLFVQIKVGSDIAFLNALMNVLITEDLYDKKFVQSCTTGFDELKAKVMAYPPEKVSDICGVSPEKIRETARLLASVKPCMLCYTLGITEHTCGKNNVMSTANLQMLLGNMGVESGGVNPLRGQNNVQGACDMACLPGNLPAYKRVAEDAERKPFEEAWGVKLPAKPGLTIPKIIDGAADGTVKALYVMGENPMMSDPDTAHVEHALKNLDLFIVQDIFLNETAQLAHVVLPSSAWAEKEGTFTNTERRVQRIRKAVDAPGEARDDWAIITAIADKMGAPWSYDSAQAVFEEVARVTASYAGITYDRIEWKGLQWPCPTPGHPGTPILHGAAFTRGKGLFTVCEHIPPAELPDREYPLMLTTGRILYQYHTSTMSRRSKGLVSRTPDAFVEVNPADAKKLGIGHGDKVEVASRRGTIEVTAEVSRKCDEGVVFIPFHYSEAAVNRLTNKAIDPVANIPEYKVCAVKMRKVA